MAAHRYWRINVTENNGGTLCRISKIEFYETNNGSNIAVSTGTVATSTEQIGHEGSKAFNSNPANDWATSVGNTTGWISYDFGLGVTKDIISVGFLSTQNFGLDCPKTFDVQYSDDNSNWTTYWTVTNFTTWAASGMEFFRFSNTVGTNDWGSYIYWRVYVFTMTNNNFICCLEGEYRATVGGADQATGGTAFASQETFGNTPSRAFDDNAGTEWSGDSSGGTGLVYGYLGYQFASAVSVAQWAWTDDGADRSYRRAMLQASSDGTNYTTLNVVEEPSWTPGEQKLQTVTNTIDALGSPLAGADAFMVAGNTIIIQQNVRMIGY